MVTILLIFSYFVFVRGFYAESDKVVGEYTNRSSIEKFIQHDAWQIGENKYGQPVFVDHKKALQFLQEEYQDVLDKQEKARLQAEYDSLVAQGKQPIPVMDETGKITGYTVLDNANQGSTVVAEKQTATTPEPAKPQQELPNTSTADEYGVFIAAALSILASVGLVATSRKKETK